jgi:hypothetical protein
MELGLGPLGAALRATPPMNLREAVDDLCYRLDGSPPGAILLLVVHDHPDRSISNLCGVLTGSAHDSILFTE